MKVKKIHIENYRMLKRIDIDLEENLSLIIGKNNCGKTSFLSILNKFIGSQSSTNNFTYKQKSRVSKYRMMFLLKMP